MLSSRISTACLMLSISFSLLACATGSQPALSRDDDIEVLLSEAGFVRHMADSPEKMERIMSEVQRKVIPVQEEEGQIYYLYADAVFCRCLYVGDEKAFDLFERMLRRRDLERNSCIDDRLRSAQTEPWREFGELGQLCRER